MQGHMNVKFIQHICKFWSLRQTMQLYCFFLLHTSVSSGDGY